MTGCFVTFEGPEGGGKTTQHQALHGYLAEAGYDVLAVHEPGSTTIGDQIRQILHDPANTSMSPTAELLLYSASRAQLVSEKIRPALTEGMVVLADRYADSTMAYQGYGHGLDLSLLQAVTRFATGGLRPDMIIYLDLAPEEGLLRKQKDFQAGTGEWNRMDQKEIEFHRRVRAGYHEMMSQDPHRWFCLDATEELASVQLAIRERVQRLLAEFRIEPIHPQHSRSGKEKR
jgi:dTMP kinase